LYHRLAIEYHGLHSFHEIINSSTAQYEIGGTVCDYFIYYWFSTILRRRPLPDFRTMDWSLPYRLPVMERGRPHERPFDMFALFMRWWLLWFDFDSTGFRLPLTR